MEKTKVPLPANVLKGLEAVRLSGKTNMLDVPMVERLALDMDFPEAAIWVHEHRNLYAQGVFRSFEATDSLDESSAGEMGKSADEDGGGAKCADR